MLSSKQVAFVLAGLPLLDAYGPLKPSLAVGHNYHPPGGYGAHHPYPTHSYGWPPRPSPSNGHGHGGGNGSPCAQVSSSWAAQIASTPTPTVAASLAYECILSVPLNKSAALDLIDTVIPYFNWQSTLAYLKDPPAEYVQKIQNGVDVFGQLDQIRANVSTGVFQQEYQFGYALYHLLQSTHDGHFVYVPDSVGAVFNWARTLPLVSVSTDGKSLPKPYAFPDILAQQAGTNKYKPSEIVSIDGEKATTWLEQWAQYGSLQDRDALYNNVFYELAQLSLGPTGSGMGTFTGAGRGRWVYPGATTELQFANGTRKVLYNYARILANFTGVVDGESLYQQLFAIPVSDTSAHISDPTTTSSVSSSSTVPTSTTSVSTPAQTPTPAPGYPPPVIRQINNLIGGYYIDAPGYEDVAVLSVPSFVGLGSAEISFQNTSKVFLAEARAAGKTKLIVDVSANGGGTILQGYDLFKQLFPFIDAFAAADRFRAIEATDLVGEKFSEISGTVPRTLAQDNATLVEIEGDIVASNFNYRTDEKPNGTPFKSWAEKYGPHEFHGDEFSSLFRWNLSDVLTPYNSGGIYVTGYGAGNSSSLTQPFKAEDVVVMTDGYCASTCTIFSALMRDLAGVKYVAMGGRPLPGITQAIGGVKGTNDLPWDYIQSLVGIVYEYSTNTEKAALNKTSLATYDSLVPFYRASPNTSYNVNFRDGIRKGDTAETPLQFVYEAADCRILYTPAMTVDVAAQWKAVADSAWNGENKCIAGNIEVAGSTKRDIMRGTQLVKRLDVAEYPLDLFTDLQQGVVQDGWMMP